jgi:hypothetical protein
MVTVNHDVTGPADALLDFFVDIANLGERLRPEHSYSLSLLSVAQIARSRQAWIASIRDTVDRLRSRQPSRGRFT